MKYNRKSTISENNFAIKGIWFCTNFIWNKSLKLYLFSAASIHTTRGFGGYRPSTCMPGSSFRFLGPSVKIAVPLTILWGTACSFLAALIFKSMETLYHLSHEAQDTSCDLFILALAEFSLALITIGIVLVHLTIDCKYDPDWCEPPTDTHATVLRISVVGGVGGFSGGKTAVGAEDTEKPSRVAWVA